jgi:predicted lipid-binding transport protein (Tim44 family)
MTNRVAAVLIAVSVLLGACGGGGGGTVSAPQFVKVACTDLGNWIKAIQKRSQNVQQAAPQTPDEGKKVISAFFDGVIADTDKLIDQLKAAGTPDVKNGDKISSTVISALEHARDALASSKAKVENLPTDNPQAFAKAAQQMGQSVQSAFQKAGQLGSSLTSPELEAAAKKEPACQSLSS